MTLAPRFLINFWAKFRVAIFIRHLRSLGRGVAAQEKTFSSLMTRAAQTEFGRTHGLTASTTYPQFRERVAPNSYQYYEPLIQRMLAGEAGVLIPEQCAYFVETAGTTGDLPKLLPVSTEMLKHYRQGLNAALCLYANRARHKGVFLGRHLHVGASTEVVKEAGAHRTTLAGMLTLSLTPWVESNLRSPPLTVANMPEGPEKNDATAQCMIGRDVTLIAGAPAAIQELSLATREAASEGKRHMTTLQEIWPNLECCLHLGAPLGLYTEILRNSLGPTVNFHELYAAAEGIIAAQDNNSPTALQLLTDVGIFFEFLPLRQFNEDALAKAGALCLPLEKIEVGVDYVLLVTTPAGLCRYVPGDIVRFLSIDPPRMNFAGRTQFQLNAFGERITERELLECLLVVCRNNGWQAVNLHVVPFHHHASANRILSSHEWWMELRTHSMKTPTANVIAPELDVELSRRNRDYATMRTNRTLDLPAVRLVMPGVFEQWAQDQNKLSGPSKIPICRSDRLIADQLAQYTKFHQSLPQNFSTTDSTATNLPRQFPDVIG